MAFSDVLGAALPAAGFALGGPVGGAIGSFAGGLALNAAAGDKMKDFERRDKGIPMDDPEQRGYLNRLAQQERYYRSGADPNTGLANRLVQQSGAQAQSNLARAGGPGTVQNLLSSQNVTNRGLAANAAQAAAMADNLLGQQGQLVKMMADRRYDRQRYRRDLSLMQGQQQQQNANNLFSSAIGLASQSSGLNVGPLGLGQRSAPGNQMNQVPAMNQGQGSYSQPMYENPTPGYGGNVTRDPYAIPSAALDQNLSQYGR
jgi:hypothetical protein